MCSFIRALVRGFLLPSAADSRSSPARSSRNGEVAGRPSWKLPACSGEFAFISAVLPHLNHGSIVLCLSNRNGGTPFPCKMTNKRTLVVASVKGTVSLYGPKDRISCARISPYPY
ncbi:hypothetical protein V8C42DRAFT_218673 [Trichoderma barbatum]